MLATSSGSSDSKVVRISALALTGDSGASCGVALSSMETALDWEWSSMFVDRPFFSVWAGSTVGDSGFVAVGVPTTMSGPLPAGATEAETQTAMETETGCGLLLHVHSGLG